jgi:polysaccharide export outer membrane protein
MLDAVALAGSAKAAIYDTLVRLSRNGVTVTMPIERLVTDPAKNIYAEPGDVLTLMHGPQTFSMFRATGQNAQITFNAERLALAEALAEAGGVQDLCSDPAGVFLFRFEPPAVLAVPDAYQLSRLRPKLPGRLSPRNRRGERFFPCAAFPLLGRDIIYIANARLNAQ